jgi:hypothetical protein
MWFVAIVGTLASSHLADAQGRGAPPASPVAVRGVAYDGLRGAPLRNALITLVGSEQNTRSDSRGRFHFDSVMPGAHTFAMQHAALDSLGFSGLSTRAMITNGREEVRIAVPSFATLWRHACGSTRAPDDSGFVYGTIRDAETGRPIGNATVDVTWTQMMLYSRKNMVQRRWHTATRSDSTGSYAVCGVTATEWLRIRAEIDTDAIARASGWIDLSPAEVRVQRRDLLLGRASGPDSTRSGKIVGVVTDAAGEVFADARIVMDGLPEIRSGADGSFTIKNAPAGTHQIEVMSVGIAPVITIVDVRAGDTTSVAIQFGMPIVLEGVKVVGARVGNVLAAEFVMRRKSGLGYAMDSTQIGQFRTVFEAIQTTPGTNVRFDRNLLAISMANIRGGTCAPQVRIDGLPAEYGHIIDLQPSEVAAIEVFGRPTLVPAQFHTTASPLTCGMILVWTKYGFRVR